MSSEPMIKKAGVSLSLLETEEAIYAIRNYFQEKLAANLNLRRVSGPLFVAGDSGIQDNLNGAERPVSFQISTLGETRFEIVHSLAKWKRYALKLYDLPVNSGIFTEMKALRPDEATLTSGIHSVYVDQWDWEKVLLPEARSLDTLKRTVRGIYMAMRDCEEEVSRQYRIEPVLPGEITFIHSEDLARQFPLMTPQAREREACREYGAVFLIGIGGELPGGGIHDGRAPDYDDWSSPTENGNHGLNGDILVWNPVLNSVLELSSMGVRVDKTALIRQLEIRGCMNRLELPWHQMLSRGELPECIGGGIGQSRLCMFMLRKSHIGQVQAGVWPECDSLIHSRQLEFKGFPSLMH